MKKRVYTKLMNLLKLVLKTLPALIFLDYTDRAGDIIFVVNASIDEWGAVLMQLVRKKSHRQATLVESGLMPKKTMIPLSGNIEES